MGVSGKSKHVINVSPNKTRVTTMIKVILALESPVLRELLGDLIEREPGIELVREVADPIDLLVEVKQTQAEVVIQEWPESEEIPGICSHLLTEYPDLLLIGITQDTGHAFVCELTIARRRFRTAELHDVLFEIQKRVPALK